MQQHSFGYWLKRKRKALNLTQAELATQVGCSAAAIRKIEAEERRPSAQIVSRLAEILEIPSSERPVFLRFARGEMRSGPVDMEENFPWHVSDTFRHSNLPATVASLIGRGQETALIREYLLNPEIRLVTIVGPPGIGKTRLSIEGARAVQLHFPDGVFFVSLAPLADPSLILFSIIQVLGYVETEHVPADKQLLNGIGNKQMLIVLDNCEHLIEDVAGISSDLLSGCSHLKILATSRELLRIPGEWVYALSTLTVPRESSFVDIETASRFPALMLFNERARAVRSKFMLTADNIHAVASICTQLDGLPLAIELMAARMRSMTPQTLLEQLNSDFVLSADGMRSISTHQRTLNDAIAWSYNLLSKEEQKLFAYLSVFSGGFTLETAEMIFHGKFTGTSMSNLITSLLDKSLLQSTFDEHDDIHFNMLVTIQQFALNCLQGMGSVTEVRNEHLAYFHDLTEQAAEEIRGPNQVEWFRRLTATRDNLRLALEWAIETQQTEIALQMTGNLSLFWFRHSILSEGRQWLGAAVTLPDAPQYPRLYSYALAQLAFHTWLQIGPEQARPLIEQALSVARTNHDKWNIAWGLTVYGLILITESNFIAAQSTLDESKALFREVQDDWGYANALISLGNGTYNQEDWASSLKLHEESLSYFKKFGDRYFQSVALRFIGMLQIRQGNRASGVTSLRDALLLAQQLDSKYEIAAGLQHLGDAAQAEGNLPRAICLYWAARKVFDSIGAWHAEDEAKLEKEVMNYSATLDKSVFATAIEEGRGISMEQAIRYALDFSAGT